MHDLAIAHSLASRHEVLMEMIFTANYWLYAHSLYARVVVIQHGSSGISAWAHWYCDSSNTQGYLLCQWLSKFFRSLNTIALAYDNDRGKSKAVQKLVRTDYTVLQHEYRDAK
jgi:hypothetical protein